MTDMIYDYITMGVDLLINAVILAGIVLLLRNATILSQISATQQANADRINYYKEYAKFDCTTKLSSADVLSAMSYYKSDHVIVTIGQGGTKYVTQNGKWYKTSASGQLVPSNMQEVSNALGADWAFKAYLFEDGWSGNGSLSTQGYEGGTISGIKFEYTGIMPN